jgi:hypothetical protein
MAEGDVFTTEMSSFSVECARGGDPDEMDKFEIGPGSKDGEVRIEVRVCGDRPVVADVPFGVLHAVLSGLAMYYEGR